jgi:phage repressor protein C with HTH and peptisase S24 domain
MVPTIAEDDLVMVDTTKRDLSFDGVFVIRDDGASLLVKRIGRGTRRGHVMVISDNPRYAPTERPLAEIEVLGKVLWMGVKV